MWIVIEIYLGVPNVSAGANRWFLEKKFTSDRVKKGNVLSRLVTFQNGLNGESGLTRPLYV